MYPDGRSELATNVLWHGGEPNNGGSAEHFGELLILHSSLNDAYSTATRTLQLCQYGSASHLLCFHLFYLILGIYFRVEP